MTRMTFVFVALLLPLTGGCTTPSNTYQPATVRWVDGHACFSVADTPESRRTPPTVAAISVSRRGADGWVQLWNWVTPISPAVTLDPAHCIPYGHASDQPERQSSAPLPLTPGEHYGVQINAQIPNPQHGRDAFVSRRYSRHFCLLPSEAGTPAIILVPRIKGEVDWSVCTTATPSLSAGE